MSSGFTIDRSDVLVLVIMALFTLKRIDVRATEPSAFPGVPGPEFDAWKALALRSRSFSINACFLKFALNSVWFYGFGPHVIPPVLATGGWLIFLGWIFAMTYAWWLASMAEGQAARLGIVAGRRPPGASPSGAEPASATEPPDREEGEASFR
jgi:hypothetical protein